MKRIISLYFVLFIISRCNNGDKFTGTWKETKANIEISNDTQLDTLNISKNDKSFILSSSNAFDKMMFNGIYTLSKEGSLIRGGNETIIIDKKTGD